MALVKHLAVFFLIYYIKNYLVFSCTFNDNTHFGHPSKVDMVKRASMPLRMLSKLRSELVHSLLRSSISCNAPSWYFINQPLFHKEGQRESEWLFTSEVFVIPVANLKTSPLTSQPTKTRLIHAQIKAALQEPSWSFPNHLHHPAKQTSYLHVSSVILSESVQE